MADPGTTRSFPKQAVTLAVASSLSNVLGFAIAKKKLMRDLGIESRYTLIILTPFKHSPEQYYEIASLILRGLESESADTLIIKNGIVTRIISRIAIGSARYKIVRWIFTAILRGLVLYMRLQKKTKSCGVLIFRPRPNWSVKDEHLPDKMQQVFYGDGFSLHCPRSAPLWTNPGRRSFLDVVDTERNALRTYLYTYPDQSDCFQYDVDVGKRQSLIGKQDHRAIEIGKGECRECIDLVTSAIETELGKLLKISKKEPLLILTTSTFHLSGAMTEHDEITLYWDVVEEQLAANNAVNGPESDKQLLIKFHPSTSEGFKEAMSAYCLSHGLTCLHSSIIDALPLEVILNVLRREKSKVAGIVVCSVGAAYASRLVLPEIKAVALSERLIREYVCPSSLDLRLRQNGLINRIVRSW